MASLQEIQNYIIGIRNKYQGRGAGAEQGMLQEIAQYVQQNKLDPNLVAQAANAVSPNGGWTPDRVQQTLFQYQATPQQQPDYGLQPTMNTLQLGGQEALAKITETQDAVSKIYQRGRGELDPYIKTGGQANTLQAALSGAAGNEAQKAAFANYNQSPGVQYAQEEAERAQLRNAAALGNLGGGNTRAELARIAAGTFTQDFGNQFDRLSGLTDRGYGASTTAAGLAGQEAGLRQTSGLTASQIPLTIARDQAGYQYQAGRDVANNIGGTTTALANWQNQQGTGQAQMLGNQVGNLNNLYQLALQGDTNARGQLAQLLQNTNMNAASAQSGLPGVPVGNTNYVNDIANTMGAAAGWLGGGQAQQQPQYDYSMPTFNNPVTGYGPNYRVPYSPNYLGGGSVRF